MIAVPAPSFANNVELSSMLAAAGGTAIFLHSWYRRVLEDHVMGLVGDKEWKRGFDEINEFEAQQRDYGTALIKLYDGSGPDEKSP